MTDIQCSFKSNPTPFAYKANSIPLTLQQVGSLPDEANVNIKTVAGLCGVSKSTIERLVKAGKLNKIKVSERSSRFKLGEVRAYLASQQEGL